MHNCGKTKERLTEMVLDGVDSETVLATELDQCVECRAEFDTLSATLRMTAPGS